MKILAGTTNPSKAERFRELLAGMDVTIITPQELQITKAPPEIGNTPAQNASLKAAFYGKYHPYAVCNDSGLYFCSLPPDDARQPGLHVRSPKGIRLTDDEMLAYYTKLIGALGGKVQAYYLDGFAVYNQGKVFQFQQETADAKACVFTMTQTPSPVRHPGWPLDSLAEEHREMPPDNGYWRKVRKFLQQTLQA